MARALLDSSCIIAILEDRDSHHEVMMRELRSNQNTEWFVSAISIAEALIFPYRRGQETGDEVARAIYRRFKEIVPIDAAIASKASGYVADLKISLVDSLIAASAERARAQLWTFDRALAKKFSAAKLLKSE